MTDSEEERAFLQMFSGATDGGFVNKDRLEERRKAERRAAMTDKQLSRGGRARNAQLNVRTTPQVRALAGKLAQNLDLSLAEMIELAISELASQKGVMPNA